MLIKPDVERFAKRIFCSHFSEENFTSCSQKFTFLADAKKVKVAGGFLLC